MENFVKLALDEAGLTPLAASRRGMPYQSVYRQYRGQRKPSAEFALMYERVLGIPCWKIRPDIWRTPPATPTTPPGAAGAADGQQPSQEPQDA